MRRILRCGLWMAVVLAAGCGKDTVGVGSGDGLPDGVVVASIIRVVTPDSPFYTIPFPPDPVPDLGEVGQWDDAYRNVTSYALVGAGFFRSMTSGAMVPLLVQVGTTVSGASLRASVDQPRGTLAVFGLLDHEVQVEIQVYRLNSAGG